MLRFTQAQQQMIINERRLFNAHQERLAATTTIGNAAPLPRDVWGMWDREGIEVQREVLSVFNDLAASVSVPVPIGKLVHHFQTISDSGEVNISLDGRSKANVDHPVYDYHGTPIPIIDTTFGYGWRQIESARTEGFQLDAAGRVNAMFKVAEKLELMALDGDSKIVVGGDTLYGLRNHPKRNTRTTGQALNGATGAQWLADVKATLTLLHNDNYKAPATLYVNWADWFYATSTDFSTAYGDKTIAQRIMEIDGVANVVPADKVTASQIIAVQKNTRTVQILNAMPPVTRPQARHNTEDDYNFAHMAAAALEIKFDATDNCGVAVSSI